MAWLIRDRGFLPTPDPPTTTIRNNKSSSEQGSVGRELDRIAATMPVWLAERKLREELVCSLREAEGSHTFYEDYSGTNIKLGLLTYSCHCELYDLERLFMLFSYFASAYIHATHEATAARLPAEIAVPLCCLSMKLRRPPVLSYPSYCLNNWRRSNSMGPICLENLELLQHFCSEGSRDEAWFVLVHVQIEAEAGRAIVGIYDAINNVVKNDEEAIERNLIEIASGMRSANMVLNRMPEQCSSDVYFKLVRPYIFGYEKVWYEGGDSLYAGSYYSVRGETGAQSSIIPAVHTGLGVHHKESMLTQHLLDMRQYMPVEHQKFLKDIDRRAEVREFVMQRDDLHEIYNECIYELARFRKKHLEYAVEYIEKKVSNPQGTGGTPYIKWLSRLASETEEFYVGKRKFGEH